MKIFTCGCIFYLLVFLCSPGCSSNGNVDNNTANLTFYYYPKANAYYDVTNSNYIYSIDSGKNWTTLPVSNTKNQETLGKKIVLHSTSTDIWKENETHRKMYGGTLINFVKHDTSTFKSTSLKSRPVIKKKKLTPITDSLQIVNKPKKKRGFFQRIFGKKHKKEQPVDTNIK